MQREGLILHFKQSATNSFRTTKKRSKSFARRAIRITATKAKARIIAEGIRSTLEGAHRIQVPLIGLKKPGRRVKELDEVDEFGEPILAELARLTNTEVVRVSKDKVSP